MLTHSENALMEETSCHIALVGARDQVSGLSNLCQQHDGSERIVNLGGRIDWSSLAAVVRRADLVIANNSGVAHLAAACARPIACHLFRKPPASGMGPPR